MPCARASRDYLLEGAGAAVCDEIHTSIDVSLCGLRLRSRFFFSFFKLEGIKSNQHFAVERFVMCAPLNACR